ncbi:MBL fold metallo-hydrolase [Peribacillus glennii]|uniref:MBL fold metallo-hydrolase n=1 Tax=Peribacillus glennii TaxID=2303991 RepID=A0A372LFG0_9BACI|nr:MBL fold metallo-hydrolase [Peribacillus glennii]RFU65018.1 MBL fold metallo-hydrolase [Peribacillus glennii]
MLEQLEVSCVTIDLPFRLNHVHCFLAKGENGWTILDSGLNNMVTATAWKPVLETHEVRNIIITHYHPDHYGYAGRLQELTGAKVSMTETDKNTALAMWEKGFSHSLRENYYKCGIPKDIADSMAGNEAGFISQVSPHPRVDSYLHEGEKIVFGKYEYEIIEAPGHSNGLICLYNREQQVLFSTDHILPKITPNISYHFYGEANPLAKFLQSLDKFKRLEAEYVIPSHGKPFMNANHRIDEIIAHHDERLSKLHEIIRTPVTVYDACQKLFGKAFNSHEMRFAIGETIAHLEYLVNKGECHKEEQNGEYIYTV